VAYAKTRTIGAGQAEHCRSSGVVVRGGVEPPTFRFSGGRSYQLSYLTATGACVLVDNGARSSGPDGI
jgi:hypothetical protein